MRLSKMVTVLSCLFGISSVAYIVLHSQPETNHVLENRLVNDSKTNPVSKEIKQDQKSRSEKIDDKKDKEKGNQSDRKELTRDLYLSECCQQEQEKERKLKALIDEEWKNYKWAQQQRQKKISQAAEYMVSNRGVHGYYGDSGLKFMEKILAALREPYRDRDLLKWAFESDSVAERYIRLILRWEDVDKTEVRECLSAGINRASNAILMAIRDLRDKDFIEDLVKQIGKEEFLDNHRRHFPFSDTLWAIGRQYPQEVADVVTKRIISEDVKGEDLRLSVNCLESTLGKNEAIICLQNKMCLYHSSLTVCNRLLAALDLLQK